MRVNGENEEMQRMANARLWQCVEDSDGITEFMKKTGLSRQTVYGIKDNRSMPSGLSLGMIQKAIPELDINKLYVEGDGLEWRKRSINGRVIEATEGELQVVAELNGIIDHLEAENADVKAKIAKLKDALLQKLMPDLDFLKSSSRPTAVEIMVRARRVDGYIRYDEEVVENECKVLPLNSVNSIVNEAIIVLNSLEAFEVYHRA